MINEYFKNRAYLGTAHSRFQCAFDCSRPGCGSVEMQVPVTLFDIIGAASHTNAPVGQVFEENYKVGVLPLEGFDWIKSVAVKLKKPCPFLNGKLCRIYEVRPLSCILFPEYRAVDGTLNALASQAEYQDYYCLRSHFSVPRERAQILRTLAGLLQREVLLSDSHLFARSPFWIDFSDLTEDLVRESCELSPPMTRGHPTTSHEISLEAFDRVFERTFLQCHPLSRLDDLIRDLHDPERMESMFARLSNKELHADLLLLTAEERPLVFKYKQGVLEARRRSLTLREHMFL